jgi:hypothetical protein
MDADISMHRGSGDEITHLVPRELLDELLILSLGVVQEGHVAGEHADLGGLGGLSCLRPPLVLAARAHVHLPAVVAQLLRTIKGRGRTNRGLRITQ